MGSLSALAFGAAAIANYTFNKNLEPEPAPMELELAAKAELADCHERIAAHKAESTSCQVANLSRHVAELPRATARELGQGERQAQVDASVDP